MGSVSPVNNLNSIAIIITAYVVVFLEASFGLVRTWAGAQIDVMPALMVYCGLSTGMVTIASTAVLAGLWLDSLSANPLGISVLPLFMIGFFVYSMRDLILRDQPYARLVLGFAAGAAAPLATVLLLWAGGFDPLIGWGSLWQWFVMTVGCGVLTPVCFWFFDRLRQAFTYSRVSESTFRSDREIKRGRA
jgi:cell shape-determining protein MreD